MLKTLKKTYGSVKVTMFRQCRRMLNHLKYGANSPQFGEQIYINPVELVYYTDNWNRNFSGVVCDGDWDINGLELVDSLFKINCCKKHWIDQVSWQETGIYDFMLEKIKQKNASVDGCSTIEDVIERYDRLDRLYEEVKETGYLKTQKQLNSANNKEQGGIFVHIGRGNKLIFGCGGMHRLAIAQVLNLESVPAQLGVLHPLSVKTWKRFKTQSTNDCLI